MPQSKEDIIKRVNNDFQYHAPHPDQIGAMVSLREAARKLALQIVESTPISREQSLALTHLEEAVFWANAGIARRSPLAANQP